jgi:cyanate lyase
MTRLTATNAILVAKKEKELTWKTIAEKIGRHEVWSTAALLGQHTMSESESSAATEILGLSKEVKTALMEYPSRGSLQDSIPVDPTIYRFYELIQVYGSTIKALIHEKFGDGIMSAIDFTMDIDKVNDPNGDRVVVTLNGKFLPYKKF